jgi:O-antigen/teichoic acid export membrane protein
MTSGAKMASGAAWMVGMRISINLLGVISTVMLTPTDYGLVAIAASLVAVLEVMSSFSFDLALIQRQDATEAHYNTAWTFNVIFGVLVALLLFVIAKPASVFFNDARLESIVYLFGFMSAIKGTANIGVVAFRKNLEFHKEFGYMVATKLVGFIATVGLAIVLRNYWALVFGTLIWNIGGVMLSYWAHSYRPRLSLEKRHDLFSFSKWLVASNIMIFAKSQGIDMVVGRIAGAAYLGLYSVAYQISNLPTTELVYPINRAIFPSFAKLANDMHAIRKGFLDVLGALALFTIPAATGLYCISQPLVDWMLGERWTDAGPLIQILALYGLSSALQANTGSLYLAIGKPKITSYLMAANLLLLFPAFIFFLTHFDIYTAAYVIFAASATLMPINYQIIVRLLGLKWRNLIAVLWRPFTAAIAMIVVLTELKSRLASNSIPDYIQVVSLVIVGAAVYSTFVVSSWLLSGRPDGAEQFILKSLVKIKSRHGNPPDSHRP